MKLTISDIEGYNGEYEYALEEFTQRELAGIEQMCGIPFSKWNQGYLGFVVALAAAVLRRAGKPVVEDMLWNAMPGSVLIEEDHGDVGPPEPSPTLLKDGVTSSSASSGTESILESPDEEPSPTGAPGSEISLDSDPETSET